jgi:ABC-type phosphate transport system permease subunit
METLITPTAQTLFIISLTVLGVFVSYITALYLYEYESDDVNEF